MGFRRASPAKAISLSDVEVGYVAGIIDGEGHIGITLHRREPYTLFSVRVEITNTSLDLHEWLVRKFGGSCHVHWKKRYSTNHSPAFRWRIDSVGARKILELVRPYLKVKRQQADLALQFISLDSKRVPSVRAEMYERMKELNKRGTGETTTIGSGVSGISPVLGEAK